MDSETLTRIFLLGGIILMALETVLPSGIALEMALVDFLLVSLDFWVCLSYYCNYSVVFYVYDSNYCSFAFSKNILR